MTLQEAIKVGRASLQRLGESLILAAALKGGLSLLSSKNLQRNHSKASGTGRLAAFKAWIIRSAVARGVQT